MSGIHMQCTDCLLGSCAEHSPVDREALERATIVADDLARRIKGMVTNGNDIPGLVQKVAKLIDAIDDAEVPAKKVGES